MVSSLMLTVLISAPETGRASRVGERFSETVISEQMVRRGNDPTE